jgi:hypothetical protein
MPRCIRHLYRSLAVATGILGLISYLPLPSGVGRGAALANSVVPSPALALAALQGAPAVQQLKEQGLYDSLAEALAETRYKLRWEDQPALAGLPLSPPIFQRRPFHATGLHPASLAAAPRGDCSPASPPADGGRHALIGWACKNLCRSGLRGLAAGESHRYRRPARANRWYQQSRRAGAGGFLMSPHVAGRVGPRLVCLEVTGVCAPVCRDGCAIALRHVNAKMAPAKWQLHARDAGE